MTEKETTTPRQAFSDGLLAALFRKPENSNPFNKGDSSLSSEWRRGYKKGMATVEYHSTELRTTRTGTSWFYQD
jgi:hypothetical protein